MSWLDGHTAYLLPVDTIWLLLSDSTARNDMCSCMQRVLQTDGNDGTCATGVGSRYAGSEHIHGQVRSATVHVKPLGLGIVLFSVSCIIARR